MSLSSLAQGLKRLYYNEATMRLSKFLFAIFVLAKKHPLATATALFIFGWSLIFIFSYGSAVTILPSKTNSSINQVDFLSTIASATITASSWILKWVIGILLSLLATATFLYLKLSMPAIRSAKIAIFIALLLFWTLVVVSFSIEASYRIQEFPVFVDKASLSGIQTGGNGGSWVDYNSDGLIDLYAGRGLYRNNGDGTFTQVSNKSRINVGRQSLRAGVFGDYDNDGCPDLYLALSSHDPKSPGENDLLYRNNCDGTFTNSTEAAGIIDKYHGTSAAWADYDNDGWLDLYVTNWGIDISEFFEILSFKNQGYVFEPNILYRGNGDGTFTNVTEKAGVIGVAMCPNIDRLVKEESISLAKRLKHSYQPIWFDYDNDGDQDLFSSTDSTISPLYRNNGDGTFTDVTAAAGICAKGTSSNMGVATGDFDNDGDLDLYITNTGENFLWRNNGDSTFTEVALETGVAELGQGWGTVFFDYNNDGWLDLLVANGLLMEPEQANDFYANAPPNTKRNNLDELYTNTGKGSFVAIGKKIGISLDEAKTGAAVADYNNDGFLDAYVNIAHAQENRHSPLYTNQKNSNHWLTVKLKGTKSNRDAVGARIILKSGGKTQIREVQAGSSFQSQNSLWQTFGLGKNILVEEIEIHWPSGKVQKLSNIEANQKITITEEL